MGASYWILGAGLFGLSTLACNPSPHIDPPGTNTGSGANGGTGGTTTTTTEGGGGTSSSSTTSQGGGGAAGCKSNADCDYPLNLCDVASGDCVECIVNSDCTAKPGTVCSKAACVCPGVDDSFCAPDGNGPARCVNLTSSDKDCGECGHACFGTCTTGECVDAWEPIAKVGAPSARRDHVAVWTGSLMIVWGGSNPSGPLSDGAMYDPDKRTWTAMSNANAPTPRDLATAVWTGTEMIVWGGRGPGNAPLADGAAFNPSTNSWANISAADVPPARYQHTAVWTGNPTTRMIVWGGFDGGTEIQTGGYYTAGGIWFQLGAAGPPAQRRLHTAVWDDVNGRMIVFGGLGYDPGTATTTSLSTGSIYGPLPGNEAWIELPLIGSPPAPRYEHTAVWATNQMIVWGGYNSALGYLNDGGRFDANGNSEWSPMDGVAPSPRRQHTAVYFKAMNKMVVWGGYGPGDAPLADGGVFIVGGTPTWSDTGLPKGPEAVAEHTAVAAGSRMIIWGGIVSNGTTTNNGAVLDMMKVP